jgi:hypothetical protein
MASSKIRTGDIRVEGLRELSRALKEIGPDLQAELRTTNRGVAEREASNAVSAANSIGGVAAKTAPSIRATAGVRSAGVGFGGAAAPYGAGAEFGGGRRPTTRQFKEWRGSGPDAGYFVYPTIRRDADAILDDYVDAVNDVIRHNFPD